MHRRSDEDKSNLSLLTAAADFEDAPSSGRPSHAHSRRSISGAALSLHVHEKQPASSGTRRRHAWGWTSEIVGVLAGLAGIGAMAAILFVTDGKARSEWLLPIQPNSLISVFSTIANAGFMSAVAQCIGQSKWMHFQTGGRVIDLQQFDQASRGALGSVKLLARLGFRSTIAIIGSLVTIASLAMGPFTQQIINYPTVPTQLGNLSELASTSESHGMVSGLYTDGFASGLNPESAPDWQQAIQGITGAMYMGMFGQSTGQPYNCATGNCSYPAITTLGICSACQDVTSQSSINSSSSQNETSKQTYYVITPGGFNISIMSGVISATRTYNTLLATTAKMSETPPGIISFAMYNSSADSFYTSLVLGVNSFTYECSLSFCERGYSGFQVTNGTANDPEATEMSFNTSTTAEDDNFFLFSSNTTPNFTYWLSNEDWELLATAVSSIFTTSMQSAYGSGTFDMVASLLWSQADGPTQVFSNMAEAMTSYMRTANATIVLGTAYSQEAYIEVRWKWFTLPAGLAAIATILQIATILFHRSKGVQVWKSSSLPLLIHGSEDLAELEQAAKKMQLRVERTQTGRHELILSSYNGSPQP